MITEKVTQLIRDGIGKRARLEHILRQIQKGENLRRWDKDYLDMLENINIVLPHNKDLLKIILDCGIGDPGRIRYMQRRVGDGKDLHKPDAEYLVSLYHRVVQDGYDEPAQESETEESQGDMNASGSVANDAPHQTIVHLDALKSHLYSILDRHRNDEKNQLADIMELLEKVQQSVDSMKAGQQELEQYRLRLSEIQEKQEEITRNISDERMQIHALIEDQRENMEKQLQLTGEIRNEWAHLEQKSSQLAEVVESMDAQKEKLTNARSVYRTLVLEEKKLVKYRKSMEKENMDMEKAREKIQKKIENEKEKIESQLALKRKMSQEIEQLNETKKRRTELEKETKSMRKTADT